MFKLNRSVLSASVAFFLIQYFAHGALSIVDNDDDDLSMQNDEIVSTVIDMNSSNVDASAIFGRFNISREDVERKLNRINDTDAEDASRR